MMASEQGRLDSLRALGVMPESARNPSAVSRPSFFDLFESGYRYLPAPTVPNKAGANSFFWNLRYPDAVAFTGMITWAAGTAGPVAPPGSYSVRIVAGDKAETQPFKLLKDPRSEATQADLDEQFAFATKIRDRTTEANNAVRTIRNVKAQLKDRLARAAGAGKIALEKLTTPLVDQLSAVEAEVYQVKNRSGQDPLNYPIKLNNQIAALLGVVSAEARPTAQSYEVFKVLSAALDAQMAKLKALLDGSLGGVNAELGRQSLGAVVPSTDELTTASGT